MPGLAELIEPLGELKVMPGRHIDANSVKDIDVLLIRSITRVDEALLRDSSVHFVGSATSGLDHVDQVYLKQRGIVLADAKGSNADAVVDYCLSAIAQAVIEKKLDPAIGSVGIVGCGEVGGRLSSRLYRMGIDVLRYDPPLRERLWARGAYKLAEGFTELEALASCSVVSLHVPLESAGPFATRNLIDREFLAAMKPDSLLINTCRGGVVNESALLELIKSGEAPRCVFDVWQGEPAVDADLVDYCALATPHIAGYSERAKLQATRMLAQALEEFSSEQSPHGDRFVETDRETDGQIWSYLNNLEAGELEYSAWLQIAAAFPLSDLGSEFKAAVHSALPASLDGYTFDHFRQSLLTRREFSELAIPAKESQRSLWRALRAAGFKVSGE